MAPDERRYHAYLLRLWPVEEAQEPNGTITVWRVTLEDIQTHNRHGFVNLERAFEFLQHRIQCLMEDRDETD